ncbi:ABC transporter permease [Anaerolinea thermophila]|uniref:Transport permease protein n=1 Tax=Anaerolinea thermophila (strain DSM 14523 / JCM 11388 / NBRC 100420 / UNI-1) TaxID=926569 RepID=E8MZC4_ANATU|nr:ABC transporter permease [Anaerolinea thermophila]BAJ62267.1 putative ABC transporter permease protein [Anaerolinea thermophila UNI-1]
MQTEFGLSQPSWRSHLRALWMIAVNNWKHHWRYPLNAVSDMLQPLVWLAPVYFMGQAFSVNGRAEGFAGFAGTDDYMSYIILGTALTNFIMAVFWGMGFSLKWDMDGGVLEANWMAPLPRPLMLVGRTLSSLATTTLTSLGMILIGALVWGFHPTGNALSAVLVAVPLLIGLYGFGFAFAALVMILREANTLVDSGSYVVMLLSGANFPVTVLPKWLLPLSLALPLTYGFDAVRAILLKTRTLLPLNVEIAILLASMVLMIVIGLRAFYALERRVRQMGTVGQY